MQTSPCCSASEDDESRNHGKEQSPGDPRLTYHASRDDQGAQDELEEDRWQGTSGDPHRKQRDTDPDNVE